MHDKPKNNMENVHSGTPFQSPEGKIYEVS